MANPIDMQVEGGASASVDLSSSTGPQTVVADTAGKNLFIISISISTDTAQSVKIINNGGGTVISRKFLPANSVWTKTFVHVPKQTGVGSGAYVVCGGSSGNVTVDIAYYLR